MHLGKFNYFVWFLKGYYETNKVKDRIGSLRAALAQYVSSPAEETSKNFRTQLNSFRELIPNLNSNLKGRAYSQYIEDMNAENYIGSGLINYVSNLCTSGSLTPVELQKNLTDFEMDLVGFIDNITNVAESLDSLGVEYDYLEKNEFELSVLLPQDIVGDKVENVSEELHHLNSLIKVIGELEGKKAESPKLRTISGCWWQFFLEIPMDQVAALVFAIERIVALIRSNLEIKKLKIEIEQKKVGDDVAALLEEKLQKALKEGLAAIATQVRKEFGKNKDEARLNELEIHLKFELLHMAKRMNQGGAYELRQGLPRKPFLKKDATEDEKLVYETEALQYQKNLLEANEFNEKTEQIAEEIAETQGSEMLTDYEKLIEIQKESSSKKS